MVVLRRVIIVGTRTRAVAARRVVAVLTLLTIGATDAIIRVIEAFCEFEILNKEKLTTVAVARCLGGTVRR